MRICLTTPVAQAPETVFAGFTRELFLRLAPPLTRVELERFDGCHTGDTVAMRLTLAGFVKQRWTSLITDFGESPEEIFFVDEGVELPFFLKTWRHRHRIVRAENGGSLIIDDIEYRSPLGMNLLLYPVLYGQFAWRKPIYRKTFGTITNY